MLVFARLYLSGSYAHHLPARFSFTCYAAVGYDAIAFNHTTDKITPKDVCSMNLPSVDTSARGALPLSQVRSDGGKSLQVKSRITVNMSDSAQQHTISASSPALMSYDIVAVCPATEKIMHHCAQNDVVDIITFDFGERLPFFLKPTPVKLAFANGIVFEVGYSAALTDAAARRNLIANTASLLHVSGGRGVILSSRAAAALELRSPADVINLAVMLGFSPQSAKHAISTRCQQVMQHALTRRTTKGSILYAPPSLASSSSTTSSSASSSSSSSQQGSKGGPAGGGFTTAASAVGSKRGREGDRVLSAPENAPALRPSSNSGATGGTSNNSGNKKHREFT